MSRNKDWERESGFTRTMQKEIIVFPESILFRSLIISRHARGGVVNRFSLYAFPSTPQAQPSFRFLGSGKSISIPCTRHLPVFLYSLVYPRVSGFMQISLDRSYVCPFAARSIRISISIEKGKMPRSSQPTVDRSLLFSALGISDNDFTYAISQFMDFISPRSVSFPSATETRFLWHFSINFPLVGASLSTSPFVSRFDHGSLHRRPNISVWTSITR